VFNEGEFGICTEKTLETFNHQRVWLIDQMLVCTSVNEQQLISTCHVIGSLETKDGLSDEPSQMRETADQSSKIQKCVQRLSEGVSNLEERYGNVLRDNLNSHFRQCLIKQPRMRLTSKTSMQRRVGNYLIKLCKINRQIFNYHM
jgi:hypothetical protein